MLDEFLSIFFYLDQEIQCIAMKMNISSGNSLVYVLKSSNVLYDWFLDNIKEKPKKKKKSLQ